MKKFSFPLSRVLDWRVTQARIEESKLEQLYAELRAIDAREAALNQQLALSKDAVLRARVVTGEQLASLDSFRRFLVAEYSRLERTRASCASRIVAQRQVVASKQRDVRLLERLREQRFKQWELRVAHEIDQQAEEAYLAKWNRSRSRELSS